MADLWHHASTVGQRVKLADTCQQPVEPRRGRPRPILGDVVDRLHRALFGEWRPHDVHPFRRARSRLATAACVAVWPAASCSSAVFLAALSLPTLALPAPATAQRGTKTDWPVYGGDPGHTRYSTLDQIDSTNAETLEVAWRWSARNQGPNPLAANQTTPIFVNGMLYATAGMRRNVVAIDPATGETIWTYRIDEGERLDEAPRVNSGRGVSYWSDGNRDNRIYVVTPGYQLVALDAESGIPIADYGQSGVVDLQENLRTRDGVALMGSIGASSPAAVIGDVLVVGAALHVGLRPPYRVNTPGDIRGFDARTGRLLWTFHTIPEPGEFGHDTWLENPWSYTGNTAVWAQISRDAELGYVYLPTEAATGDYYGGHRPGSNLFSTSILTLDARTGKRVWHFQTIHHDIWDWDHTNAPILGDVNIAGPAAPHRRADHEAGICVCARSGHGRTQLADRGARRSAGRSARRVVQPHAAVPHETRTV